MLGGYYHCYWEMYWGKIKKSKMLEQALAEDLKKKVCVIDWLTASNQEMLVYLKINDKNIIYMEYIYNIYGRE